MRCFSGSSHLYPHPTTGYFLFSTKALSLVDGRPIAMTPCCTRCEYIYALPTQSNYPCVLPTSVKLSFKQVQTHSPLVNTVSDDPFPWILYLSFGPCPSSAPCHPSVSGISSLLWPGLSQASFGIMP